MDDATRRRRRRPVPYAARAKQAGAGIVRPTDLPPQGARQWKKWTLHEARAQGQGELFANPTSVRGDLKR
jgi:hypothetical protein